MKLVGIALLATLGTGCIGICGAYEGQRDQVFAREGEMIIVCENTGVVANLSSATIEGRLMTGLDGTFATNGEDGSLAFDWVDNADGSVSTPQLAGATWTRVAYDEVAFDHAHVQCSDLESRPWWNQQ